MGLESKQMKWERTEKATILSRKGRAEKEEKLKADAEGNYTYQTHK